MEMDPISADGLAALEAELDLAKQDAASMGANLAAVTAERDALKSVATDPKRAATWERVQAKVAALRVPKSPTPDPTPAAPPA